MSLTFPKAQAIRFLESGQLSFNEGGICGCENDEKWAYQFTDGDSICFQMRTNCEDSADFISNGSFELGESSTDITDWTRVVDNVEQTNVTRVVDNTAPCNSYVAKWANVAATPNTATLTQTHTFAVGNTYKLTLKAKIEYQSNTIGNILKIIIGGQEYFITPSLEWEEYTINVTFSDAPTTTDFVITMNEIPTDVLFMYVDCVSMVEFGECCITGHANNGCFELGQRDDETNNPTFDNWVGDASEDLTGGFDGGRCAVLASIGNSMQQNDVLLDNTNFTLKFWGRANANATSIQITTEGSSTVIGTVALTTTWTQYTITFFNVSDSDVKFESITDEAIYLDCVEITSRPDINIYINADGEYTLVSPDVISSFDGGLNVCIPIDDYNFPPCFTICVESCFDNLFLNGDFEQGSGNLFTSWALTQPSRTNILLRSQEFDNASWGKTSTSVTANSTIAPDGTLTADTITGTGGTTTKFIQQNVTLGAGTYTFSFYVKYNTQRFIQILVGSAGLLNLEYTNIDLLLGTKTDFNGAVSEIFEVENGFYRVSLTFPYVDVNQVIILFVDSLAVARGASTSSTNSLYLWGAQLEAGAFITPYIPTTIVSVTTNLGEFLQDTTGGVDGGRCMKMWADAGGTTRVTQNINQVDGVTYTISFWAKADVLYGNDYLTGPTGASLINSTDWKLYTQQYVAVGSGSTPISFDFTNDETYGFVYLDNVIFYESTDIMCSENMNYTDALDSCSKELVWYNVAEGDNIALDIDYASGFVNRMRLVADFQNPQYIIESYSKTLNGDVSSVNSIKVKKTNDFAVNALPEFVIDILAMMLGVSNIEYNGSEWCSVEESEVSPQPDNKSRLMNVTITLSPKGEYIADSSFNCR